MAYSKNQFLEDYRAQLVRYATGEDPQLAAIYGWALDEAKLAKFMASVARTIGHPHALPDAGTWNYDSSVARIVWRARPRDGVFTPYSLKALRALPTAL